VLGDHKTTTECIPVPVRPMVKGELAALLAMLTFAPVTGPPEVGANVTVNVADCPGVSVVPFGIPLALNAAPVTVTPEIVMFEFPLFVKEVVSELLPASSTPPKARLVALAPRTALAA